LNTSSNASMTSIRKISQEGSDSNYEKLASSPGNYFTIRSRNLASNQFDNSGSYLRTLSEKDDEQ